MASNIYLGLCPQSIAVKVASFFDKSYNFSEEAFVKYLTTAPTSHVKLCFGKDGFILQAPFMYRQITGCFPTSIPSISTKDDSILRIVFKTL